MQQDNIRVLNVASPRASREPEVAPFVISTLDHPLQPGLLCVSAWKPEGSAGLVEEGNRSGWHKTGQADGAKGS